MRPAAHATEPDTALRGHGGPVKAIALSADGTQALSASFDYSIIHWDLSGPEARIIRRFTDHDAAVNAVSFIPGTRRAISASDDATLAVWDLDEGKLIKRFTGHRHKIVQLAVSGNGKWAASAAWDRTARLWNLADLVPGPVLKGHSNSVNDVALSGEGNLVYTASYDGTIRQWLRTSGTEVRILHKHGWGVNTLQLIAGGGQLVFGAVDGTVATIDLTGTSGLRVLATGDRPVLSLAVLAEENLVAAGTGAGRIDVWDTESWQLKFQHQFPFGPVWGLALKPDGASVYFTGLDDAISHWQMKPDKPFEVARPKLPRRFQTASADHPGALQFARKCSICHTLTPGDANRAGPSLFGIFGRKVGTLPGYPYSETLKKARFIWNAHTIDRLFAEGPENFVPGTKMPLQKMDKAEDRKALIDYLEFATRPDAKN